MTERLRIAIVGAGYFSQFQYEAWRRCPEVEVVGLAERDSGRGQAMAERFAVPRVCSSIQALLEDTQPDLVDIVTPPETHKPMVAAATACAVPMVCQKPLAPSFAEARALVEMAEAAGVPLIVHENFRFQPWYRHAKALLKSGRLGTPHGIAFRLRPGDGQGPEAYLNRQPYFQKMARFLIHETGIHFIDTFRYLLGEVTAVTARLHRLNPAIAGEDAGQVIFEFESGATGLFDGNRLNDHNAEDCRLTMGEMHLEGSGGVLRLDGDGGLWFKPHGGPERPEPYDWEKRGFAGDSVYLLTRHILSHLTEGTPLSNSGRDYLRNVEIEEAIYRSSETGQRIEIG